MLIGTWMGRKHLATCGECHYEQFHDKCAEDQVEVANPKLLDKWLLTFIVETARQGCQTYPSKTLRISVQPNVLAKDDSQLTSWFRSNTPRAVVPLVLLWVCCIPAWEGVYICFCDSAKSLAILSLAKLGMYVCREVPKELPRAVAFAHKEGYTFLMQPLAIQWKLNEYHARFLRMPLK